MSNQVTSEEVQAATAELLSGRGEYADLIKVLADKEKRNLPAIIKEATEAIAEGRRDYSAAAPVVVNTSQAIRQGVTTSEFKMASFLSKVLMLVSIAAPILEGILAAVKGTEFGNSMWVTGLGIFLQTIITQNYAAKRTRLKEQALEAEVISSENLVTLAKLVKEKVS